MVVADYHTSGTLNACSWLAAAGRVEKGFGR